MTGRLTVWLLLFVVSGLVPAAAQNDLTRESRRVLVMEARVGPDSSAPVEVVLERRVVYWVELSEPAMPAFRRRDGSTVAFVSPMPGSSTSFEVFPRHSGTHVLTLTGHASGGSITARIYRDAAETERIAARRDRSLAVGVQVGAGAHTGYRLDPTGGADPSGGHDFEACLLAESGLPLGACIGLARQAFPDHGYTVTWLFLEPRVRVFAREWWGGRRIEIGGSVRFSAAFEVGPREYEPVQAALGVYVSQRLSAGGRRGLSIVGAFQFARLGGTVETEFLDSQRLTLGVAWLP